MKNIFVKIEDLEEKDRENDIDDIRDPLSLDVSDSQFDTSHEETKEERGNATEKNIKEEVVDKIEIQKNKDREIPKLEKRVERTYFEKSTQCGAKYKAKKKMPRHYRERKKRLLEMPLAPPGI